MDAVSQVFKDVAAAVARVFFQTEEIHIARRCVQDMKSLIGKIPNYEPGKQYRVGDYGIMDPDTGILEVSGSVYDDESTRERFAPHLPNAGHPEDLVILCSGDAKQADLTDDSDLAGSIMRSRWTFGAKRSSLIVMVGTRTIHMPPDVRRLLYEDSALRRRFQEDGYVLVTEVNECKAYTLILDANENDCVELSLLNVGTDQQPQYRWWKGRCAGIFSQATGTTEDAVYYPLLKVKSIRELRRGEDSSWDEMWEEAEMPWGTDSLDDNGEIVDDYTYQPSASDDEDAGSDGEGSEEEDEEDKY